MCLNFRSNVLSRLSCVAGVHPIFLVCSEFVWRAVSVCSVSVICLQTFLAFSSVIQEGSPSLLGLGFEVSELMMEAVAIDIWC